MDAYRSKLNPNECSPVTDFSVAIGNICMW